MTPLGWLGRKTSTQTKNSLSESCPASVGKIWWRLKSKWYKQATPLKPLSENGREESQTSKRKRYFLGIVLIENVSDRWWYIIISIDIAYFFQVGWIYHREASLYPDSIRFSLSERNSCLGERALFPAEVATVWEESFAPSNPLRRTCPPRLLAQLHGWLVVRKSGVLSRVQ